MIRWSPARPIRPRCPHARLMRLLGHWLPADWRIDRSEAKAWASANFQGARHIMRIILPNHQPPTGAIAFKLQQDISELAWPITGHIVADFAAKVAEDGDGICLEILTVED